MRAFPAEYENTGDTEKELFIIVDLTIINSDLDAPPMGGGEFRLEVYDEPL